MPAIVSHRPGDVNSDGYDDILIGAPGYAAGGIPGGPGLLLPRQRDRHLRRFSVALRIKRGGCAVRKIRRHGR